MFSAFEKKNLNPIHASECNIKMVSFWRRVKDQHPNVYWSINLIMVNQGRKPGDEIKLMPEGKE